VSRIPRLEESIDFADNPEPRCPCVLLLDTSGSMDGAHIGALNAGLVTFKDSLVCIQDADSPLPWGDEAMREPPCP